MGADVDAGEHVDV